MVQIHQRGSEVVNPFSEIKEVKESVDNGMKNKIKAFENALHEDKLEDFKVTESKQDKSFEKTTHGEYNENIENEKDISCEPNEGKKDFREESVSENPHKEETEGKKYYDDNGNLYRVENNLEPNTEYEINGYKYTTDEQGRIISVEGNLHMKEHEGRLPIKDSIEDIGKGDQKENDDRGHLVGDQFDGSNGLENMIPQDSDVNRKDFKNFENELAKAVKDGKTVNISIEPVYEGNSRRPEAIVVTYSIDGQENIRVFPNGKED